MSYVPAIRLPGTYLMARAYPDGANAWGYLFDARNGAAAGVIHFDGLITWTNAYAPWTHPEADCLEGAGGEPWQACPAQG